jgi:hypothetical protein
MTSVFYGFLIGFICMLTGIGLVGYFHLKMIRMLHKFGKAVTFSFLGLIVFLILYLFVENLFPDLGILALIIPLSGAVVGFNLARR